MRQSKGCTFEELHQQDAYKVIPWGGDTLRLARMNCASSPCKDAVRGNIRMLSALLFLLTFSDAIKDQFSHPGQ